MASIPRIFDTSTYYHVYNRGVDKRDIFLSGWHYVLFMNTLQYYTHAQKISFAQYRALTSAVKNHYWSANPLGINTQRVDVIAYCLMPNHYHLVLRPVKQSGITMFMSDISNSFTRYFNRRNKRSGRLFEGPYKLKEIKKDESLLQLTRYVHLNPLVSKRTNPHGNLKIEDYPYSSYNVWINISSLDPSGLGLLSNEVVGNWVSKWGGEQEYESFVKSKIGSR